MIALVDSHCHLHFKDYPLDKQQILIDASKAGVNKIICVGTMLEDSRAAMGYAAEHDNVWATAGVHPHDAIRLISSKQQQKELKEILQLPSIIATGEIGLDYFKKYSSPSDQQAALRLQIEAGLESKKPFIFHVRDAWDDFWKIYDSYSGITGVIHSFSAGVKQLDKIMQRQLYVGLNGIMTFTKDEDQLSAAKAVPLDKLLLETDAPFLTPVPYRGKTCEPKHILNIAQFLAELRGETLDKLATATTANASKLFKI